MLPIAQSIIYCILYIYCVLYIYIDYALLGTETFEKFMRVSRGCKEGGRGGRVR